MKPTDQVMINGRAYIVRPFNVLGGYDFYHSTAPREMRCREALRQCVAPDGSDLSIAEAFDKWFSLHPRDLLPLQAKALDALRRPYTEAFSVYGKARKELFRGVNGRAGLKVPPGWNRTAFFGRIVTENLCNYGQLANGELTIFDVMEMHRMLDWKDHCACEAASRRKR